MPRPPTTAHARRDARCCCSLSAAHGCCRDQQRYGEPNGACSRLRASPPSRRRLSCDQYGSAPPLLACCLICADHLRHYQPSPFALSRPSLSGLTSLYSPTWQAPCSRPAAPRTRRLLAPTHTRLSGSVPCSSLTSPTSRRQNPTSGRPLLRDWIDRPATQHTVPDPVPPSPHWPRLLQLRSHSSTTSASWLGRTAVVTSSTSHRAARATGGPSSVEEKAAAHWRSGVVATVVRKRKLASRLRFLVSRAKRFATTLFQLPLSL